jgi:hypothetical protein
MPTKKRKVDEKATASADAIAAYGDKQTAGHAAICRALSAEIEAVLPKATSKIWHAIPVWFVGDCPVVGYKASAKHVNLLFWNGQSFGDPALEPAGSFKAAQIKFTDVSQIDRKALRRWLKKAGTDIWDFRTMRNRK